MNSMGQIVEPVTSIPDKNSILRDLRSLKNLVDEESEKVELLAPLIDEIQSAIELEHLSKALQLIDELEELMDREFCRRKRATNA